MLFVEVVDDGQISLRVVQFDEHDEGKTDVLLMIVEELLCFCRQHSPLTNSKLVESTLSFLVREFF